VKEIRRKMEEITDFPEGAEGLPVAENPSNESATNSSENAAAEGPTT